MMNPLTLDFLAAYEQQMAGVQTAAQMHTVLADWLYDQYTTPFANNLQPNNHYPPADNNNAVAAVVADLNAALQLPQGAWFQPHIPTAAVGSLSGLAIVSANPLVNSIPILGENNYRRQSPACNRSFSSELSVFHQEAARGGGNWWSHAIKLTHLVYTNENQILPAAQRWAWVLNPANNAHVGNVDLIPFHSCADGFGVLAGNQPARVRLRQLALSTLTMVLGLAPAPRLTFVGSPLGAQLTFNNHAALGLQLLPNPADEVAPYNTIQRFENPITHARVMTFPYQIYAGWFNTRPPVGFTWFELAARMRDFANPPF